MRNAVIAIVVALGALALVGGPLLAETPPVQVEPLAASDEADVRSDGDDVDAAGGTAADEDAPEPVVDAPDVVSTDAMAPVDMGPTPDAGEPVTPTGACLCSCACKDEGAQRPADVKLKPLSQALANAMTNELVPQRIVQALKCEELDELKHTIWARHGFYFQLEAMREQFMRRYDSIAPNPAVTEATIQRYLTSADHTTILYTEIARRAKGCD